MTRQKNQLHLDPSASCQEVHAAQKPAAGLTLPKSPDKSQLKRGCKILRKDVARGKSKRDKLNREMTKIKNEANRKRWRDSATILNNKESTKILKKENNKCEKKLSEEKDIVKTLMSDKDKLQIKVLSLEKNVTSLSDLLKEEKQKSRIVVADLMARAEASMHDAHDLSSLLARKEKELELEMFASKEHEKDAVREERHWTVTLITNRELPVGAFILPSLLLFAHSALVLSHLTRSPVKNKQNKHLTKLESERDAVKQMSAIRLGNMKAQLAKEKQGLSTHREKWQGKLDRLSKELDHATNKVHREKSKSGQAIQEQINKMASSEAKMQNHTEELEESSSAQSPELEQALRDECVASKSTRAASKATSNAKTLAATRLEKWHDERNLNRLLHDELVGEQEIAKEANAILAKCESLMMNSELKQRKMKKEWSNAEVARSRDGSQNWPVWVVQLVCELLASGAPPSAAPGNIQIMCETLHGEEAEDLPPASFV